MESISVYIRIRPLINRENGFNSILYSNDNKVYKLSDIFN